MNNHPEKAGPTLYLAGPLFCEAKRDWHRKTKTRLEAAGFKVVWPFELCDQATIASWGDQAPARIMAACRDALAACDGMVALLDGPQVDDGTSWEIGYAYALGMPVTGIRTDFRAAGDVPGALVNAMIHASCRAIVRTVDELVDELLAHHPRGAGVSREARPQRASGQELSADISGQVRDAGSIIVE